MMYAGFDIGGTTMRARLYDETWTDVGDVTRETRDHQTPEVIAEAIVDTIETMLPDDASSADLEAIGVGLAAQLDVETGTVQNAPNLGWREVPFVELIRAAGGDAFDAVSMTLVNDLNALLWGEYTRGAVRDADDVLAVYVGTGVGGALLNDGALVLGTSGYAGEIGHSKVEMGGRLCGCGERGCVEAYAGGVHLERRVAHIARDETLAPLWSDAAHEEVDLAEADALADEHDALDDIWEEATDMLGLVVANACTLLNPGALLLGGGIVEHLESYRRRLLSKISPAVLGVARNDLEIRAPDLGDRAGVLGAARLALQRRETN